MWCVITISKCLCLSASVHVCACETAHELRMFASPCIHVRHVCMRRTCCMCLYGYMRRSLITADRDQHDCGFRHKLSCVSMNSPRHRQKTRDTSSQHIMLLCLKYFHSNVHICDDRLSVSYIYLLISMFH